MNKELKEMIGKSTFRIEEGRYAYAKARSVPANDEWHFMVSRDADDITVVTREDHLAGLDLIERNEDAYTLFALNVAVPFYSVGFLAAVSGAIAAEDINVLIVSTYSKDYVLVNEGDADRVRDVLIGLGFGE